ncbi:formate/nitrite transporter family protein [Halogeometricum luteum]|uniref:Formate/nitrite transporter family protein n=1 Tax=Halogeometricum luteum TaxID=2950537 RepID=A0ABU2FY37_9EURY|nr:formate/nitrite transporter family protein [Halogeometricum sp. S3BR5-2]MDS0293151.1 formate/nitrite transporter family protein [Halogeometricum sp. S3BR5-2]
MSSDESEYSGATLSYRHILEREMENALQEIHRPVGGVFLSAFAAGLNLSFGALFMAMALTFSGGFESTLVQQTVLAGISSIAFLFVVVGQTELFTAHSTMAILPVVDGRASLGELGRVWGVTYVGNLLGCVAFSALAATLGPAMGVVDSSSFGALAGALVPHPWWVVLLSGVVAGWLMGLVTWLSAASRDTVGRILFVLLVTALIGFGPFHHSILGTTEVLTALLLGQGVGPAGLAHFLVWTTLGNVVGGSVFVGLLNYGHASRPGEEQHVELE